MSYIKVLKYAITVIIVVAIIVVFAVVASNNMQFSNEGGSAEKDGNYYTVEQARQVITKAGHRLGDDIEIKSKDGDFFYKVRLVDEEFNYLTVSGYVEFTAKYDAGRWTTRINPKVSYNWKLTGKWFAETEHYDVYMNIVSYTDSTLQLVLEAQYDSTKGGKGSYGEQYQTVSVNIIDGDYRKEDGKNELCLSCQVSGGYPVFFLRIDKDTMTVWQLYDSYKAECVPG